MRVRHRQGRNIHRIGVALAAASIVFLSGCINVVPLRLPSNEKSEAIALARILRRLAPQAQELLRQENNLANELKVTLDESGGMEPNQFRQRFNSYVDRLVAIRDQREQIQETIRQSAWQSPMVQVVQHDAILMLQDEITRSETWIRLTQNVRLRTELGRQKDFPELTQLSHQLAGFLAQTGEDPLNTQIRSLQEEYRFGLGELGP